MNKRIEIIVDPQGNCQVETKGFTGAECEKASRFVEQALGKQVSRRKTAEFFSAEIKQAQQARETE